VITENVKKALEEYRQVTKDMEADPQAKNIKDAIASIQDQLTSLQTDLSTIQSPYRTTLYEIEDYVRVQALEIGTSFEHAGVKVSYRKGYERITWTSKEMDDICLKNPALLSVLAPARKVTPVNPSVSIAMLEVDKEPKESL